MAEAKELLEKRAEEEGGGDEGLYYTEKQQRVLTAIVEHPEKNTNQIGRAADVHPSYVTYIIKRLPPEKATDFDWLREKAQMGPEDKSEVTIEDDAEEDEAGDEAEEAEEAEVPDDAEEPEPEEGDAPDADVEEPEVEAREMEPEAEAEAETVADAEAEVEPETPETPEEPEAEPESEVGDAAEGQAVSGQSFGIAKAEPESAQADATATASPETTESPDEGPPRLAPQEVSGDEEGGRVRMMAVGGEGSETGNEFTFTIPVQVTFSIPKEFVTEPRRAQASDADE